jgi:hypothetical protein
MALWTMFIQTERTGQAVAAVVETSARMAAQAVLAAMAADLVPAAELARTAAVMGKAALSISAGIRSNWGQQ